jgi:hypothetical protein
LLYLATLARDICLSKGYKEGAGYTNSNSKTKRSLEPLERCKKNKCFVQSDNKSSARRKACFSFRDLSQGVNLRV